MQEGAAGQGGPVLPKAGPDTLRAGRGAQVSPTKGSMAPHSGSGQVVGLGLAPVEGPGGHAGVQLKSPSHECRLAGDPTKGPAPLW